MKTKLLITFIVVSLFLMPNKIFGQANDLCYTSSFSIFKATGAFSAGPICGSEIVYQGQNGCAFSLSVIANSTSYLWEYSGSGIIIHSHGNEVIIDFSEEATSGALTVRSSDLYPTEQFSTNFAITVKSLPENAGMITGPLSVISGQQNVSYNVSKIGNATTYLWTYSGNGATLTGNSNSITIDFDVNATSGYLTVAGLNGGGEGVVSPKLKIEVKPVEIRSSSNKLVNLATGAVSKIEDAVKLFPNPANEVINIVSDYNIETITLYNFTGQTVYNKTVSGTNLPVDVSAFMPGMYFIKVETQSGLVVKRVTIR